MFYTYILKSINFNRFYIGHSSDLQKRLRDHNSGLVKSTKRFLPWKIIYTEIFKSKSEAYRRELIIKSYKSGNAFKVLLKNSGG